MSSAGSTESSLTPSDTASTTRATTRKAAAAKLRAAPPSHKGPPVTRASESTNDLQSLPSTPLAASSMAIMPNPLSTTHADLSVEPGTASIKIIRTTHLTAEPERHSSPVETPTTTLSPLAESLLATTLYPNSVSKTYPLDNISLSNNPRTLQSMGDNANYWIDSNGNALVLRFPATLDLDSSYSRITPYFNLSNEAVCSCFLFYLDTIYLEINYGSF